MNTIQFSFPDLKTLKAYPFQREQPVPNDPQIYLMYSRLDHAGRVGSCAGKNQFRRHIKWFEDMRKGIAIDKDRLDSSNFCWDAHRWGADRFVYYILERGPHLNSVEERHCREQLYMDALRDQTDMEDYTGQAAHKCPLHPAPRKYLRRKPRP